MSDTKRLRKHVELVPDAEKPVPPQVLEQAIIEMSEGVKKLLGTRVKRDVIITLLHDTTGIGKRDIGYVLNALESMERNYLKPIIK